MDTSFFHLCTSEDHSDIFVRESDFKTAINVLALCISLFDGVKLYCFELMSNHLHMLLSGSREEIESFFRFYIKMLFRCFKSEGSTKDLLELPFKCHPVDSLDYLMNVIVYIHRNASVADKKVSPYTYRWGTGRYYFNPEALARYNACKQRVYLCQRQQFSHSRKFDNVTGLFEIDNCISPFSFCEIEEGERVFSGAGQYLFMLAKNVESSRAISAEIGESITYNDYELYPVLTKAAVKMFDISDISTLSANQKMQLAKMLHYDYNSGNKQICRLLKINIAVVDELFPLSSPKKFSPR